MLLVLDNYDSFTFNLVQYLGELAAQHPLAAELRVERNDTLSLDQIRELEPAAILTEKGIIGRFLDKGMTKFEIGTGAVGAALAWLGEETGGGGEDGAAGGAHVREAALVLKEGR